ncbi:Oidioi.mRNA.OKI2018_I69.chr1.g3399.t2.cds [Oikopleura dioica]|uniref:Oidioi.mRNA.OKI2018_I69.chr1.g3399.t2.cds n=1 Tax=Oikopleura dioica TaxID=34765 RepID=A0ABN7SXX4_OIKDI|nr:Oidioi.mRNA.OKI2018_I69.chr1.g3399.t2.cds [Oikopleura dioica]
MRNFSLVLIFALANASWVSDFKFWAVLSLRDESTLDEKAEQIRQDVFQNLADPSKIFITLVYEVPDGSDPSRKFSTAKIGQKDSATEATLSEADCAGRNCCDSKGCYRAIGIEFSYDYTQQRRRPAKTHILFDLHMIAGEFDYNNKCEKAEELVAIWDESVKNDLSISDYIISVCDSEKSNDDLVIGRAL